MKREKDQAIAKEIEKYAERLCSDREISDFFLMGQDELLQCYADELFKGRAKGKIWLRQKAMELVNNGDTEILKMLVKEHLGKE